MKESNRGFTLIEIVLVLAIAGLILIAVFLAVSGAQKQRRDFQRKTFAGIIAAAVETYFANNHAYPDPAVPATVTQFEANYFKTTADPLTGVNYASGNGTLVYRPIGAPHGDYPPVGTMYLQYGHWCNRDGRPHIDNTTDPIGGDDISAHNFALWVGTENGRAYCVDNYQD